MHPQEQQIQGVDGYSPLATAAFTELGYAPPSSYGAFVQHCAEHECTASGAMLSVLCALVFPSIRLQHWVSVGDRMLWRTVSARAATTAQCEVALRQLIGRGWVIRSNLGHGLTYSVSCDLFDALDAVVPQSDAPVSSVNPLDCLPHLGLLSDQCPLYLSPHHHLKDGAIVTRPHDQLLVGVPPTPTHLFVQSIRKQIAAAATARQQGDQTVRHSPVGDQLLYGLLQVARRHNCWCWLTPRYLATETCDAIQPLRHRPEEDCISIVHRVAWNLHELCHCGLVQVLHYHLRTDDGTVADPHEKPRQAYCITGAVTRLYTAPRPE